MACQQLDLRIWRSGVQASPVALFPYTGNFTTLCLSSHWCINGSGTYYWGVPCDGLVSRPGWGGGGSNTLMHATGIITYCSGVSLVCTRLYFTFTCESPVGIDRDASTSYCSGLNEAMVSIY